MEKAYFTESKDSYRTDVKVRGKYIGSDESKRRPPRFPLRWGERFLERVAV